MLCRAHTALTGVSPSASRSIPIICYSLYWLFLIVLLLFLRRRTLPLSRPLFRGQVTSANAIGFFRTFLRGGELRLTSTAFERRRTGLRLWAMIVVQSVFSPLALLL